VRRIVFGAGAAITGGLGIAYNKLTKDALAVYHAETTLDLSVHDTNWNKFENNMRIRNVYLSAAGALTLGFTISIPF
jgi:hypothetical protein